MTARNDERRTSDRLDVSEARIGHRFGHFRHSAVRICAVLLAGVAFFYAADAIDPGQSAAVNPMPAAPAPTVTPRGDAQSLGSMGELSGLEYVIEIHATAEGPRYTVRSASGEILGAMLEAAEVEIVAPGAQMDGMIAEPMMLAEPRNDFRR